MLKNPTILLELYGLIQFYNQQLEAAKAIQSDGGAKVTANEMLGIALAVFVPALEKFLLPTIPRDTIQAIAAALEVAGDRLEDIREQAAGILNKAESVGESVLQVLEE
ncbi:MAG: hypothetical protein F6K00_19615 [Leptolyngbya sp. SIOISBB]|nr:hypothetical protein [Leptolyngbya sp. SIOISBB]